MSETISNNLERVTTIWKATDEALAEWTGEGNLQFPILLGMIAVRMKWDERQVRDADPFVRFHVRNHPDWHVTRGAHGGIMRRADKDKKDAAKLAKDLVKKQMADALEAKVAGAASGSSDEGTEN